MKQTIFDVLMYLFENYMEDELDVLTDTPAIRKELHAAGFEQREVVRAFDWLESLTVQDDIKPSTSTTFRIFSTQESAKLDIECRNLLIFLEYIGILSAVNREVVIDRAMALDDEEISVDQLKWIALMILFSQPDEEMNLARMEDMVYDFSPLYLH